MLENFKISSQKKIIQFVEDFVTNEWLLNSWFSYKDFVSCVEGCNLDAREGYVYSVLYDYCEAKGWSVECETKKVLLLDYVGNGLYVYINTKPNANVRVRNTLL